MADDRLAVKINPEQLTEVTVTCEENGWIRIRGTLLLSVDGELHISGTVLMQTVKDESEQSMPYGMWAAGRDLLREHMEPIKVTGCPPDRIND